MRRHAATRLGRLATRDGRARGVGTAGRRPTVSSYLAQAPRPSKPTWERLAERLQPEVAAECGGSGGGGGNGEPNGEEVAASAYLSRIRAARGGASLGAHAGVKELQEELQEEIAAALGRTALAADAAYALLEVRVVATTKYYY